MAGRRALVRTTYANIIMQRVIAAGRRQVLVLELLLRAAQVRRLARAAHDLAHALVDRPLRRRGRRRLDRRAEPPCGE